MSAALWALLTQTIDYAGLFPPAQLPLEQAIRNYARYRQEPESWMLGRFICPAARLEELAPYRKELFGSGSSLDCSVLGRGGKTIAEFQIGLHTDLETIARAREHLLIKVFEVRLPPEITAGPAEHIVPKFFNATADVIAEHGPPIPAPFYEPNLGTKLYVGLPQIVATLKWDYYGSGIKLRCGGTEASAFPSSEQVAFTIAVCRNARVPLKFTAGLHHPIRHFNADLHTYMHGFINVFAAGVLAYARQLNEEQVRAIIADEDPGNFAFDDQGLGWKDDRATVAEIIEARKYVVSFGSCSFDEPRDDLRALGWLK